MKYYTKSEIYCLLQNVISNNEDCEKLAKVLSNYDFVSLLDISMIIIRLSKGIIDDG